jgi:hypothetical protein
MNASLKMIERERKRMKVFKAPDNLAARLSISKNYAPALRKADNLTVAAARKLHEAGDICMKTTWGTLACERTLNKVWEAMATAKLHLKVAKTMRDNHLFHFVAHIMKGKPGDRLRRSQRRKGRGKR